MIVIMYLYNITYIYKLTLVVGIKALRRIKRSECIIGGNPTMGYDSGEENLQKIGVSVSERSRELPGCYIVIH